MSPLRAATGGDAAADGDAAVEAGVVASTAEAEAEPVDDGRCFACGPKSEHGLRLRFARGAEPGSVEARTSLAAAYQGWVGFAHGGVVCMLLDEGMAHAAALAGHRGVTAGMKVRFRAPTPLSAPLRVVGRLVEARRRLLRLRAEVLDDGGRLLASAEGDFISRGPIDPEALFRERQ